MTDDISQIRAACVLLSLGLLRDVLAVLSDSALPELAAMFARACAEHDGALAAMADDSDAPQPQPQPDATAASAAAEATAAEAGSGTAAAAVPATVWQQYAEYLGRTGQPDMARRYEETAAQQRAAQGLHTPPATPPTVVAPVTAESVSS
jgi:hypothetical protein